ncbi:sodium-independent sulfate anion transporter-like isoform X2 [Chironomus tepperi]|uniref:sodium-independent sulfate anion transporter-like isoform X2 n=1 Tax=Chironomus tepperi TaxID=113505 RepID=UPI00391EFC27
MTEYSPIFRNPQHVHNVNDSEIYQEKFPNVCDTLTSNVGKCCSEKTLKRRLPILTWMPKYTFSTLFYDTVAGLSVGLTVIPQGIAYAVVAGLKPQYGLYSSFMGCFMYTIFGSCKDITIGPTAIMSLMIYSAVNNLNVDFAILGTFLSGLVILFLGVLNLGFLVQFISTPTIIAFTTAATVTIGSSQVRPLLGIKFGTSNEFIESWKNVIFHLDEATFADTTLGLISLVLLLLLKKPTCLSRWKVLSKYLSISRNAIIVVIGIIVAYLFEINGMTPFNLTGDIAKGLPAFKVPPLSTELNGTDYTFMAMFNALGLSLITLPLVSILESVAIAKSFSKGKVVDATQEMIALGLCNVASSFFQSIPITGSFTRTAVNHNSGVKTTFGGVITGFVVLLALGLLTETFYFIPKTTLAAVIIAAMISMIDIHEVIEIYKTKRSDFIPFLVTFFVSLWLGLEFGIIAGIVINMLMMLYISSRPLIDYDIEKVNDTDILIVTVDQSLNYLSAEYFKTSVEKKVIAEYPSVDHVFINGMSINYSVDVTVVKNIVALVEDLKVCKKQIYFLNWRQDAFHLVMRYKREYFNLFKFGTSVSDILLQESKEKSEEQQQFSAVITDE